MHESTEVHPGEAHTDTESASLDVLDRCHEIYAGIAEREL